MIPLTAFERLLRNLVAAIKDRSPEDPGRVVEHLNIICGNYQLDMQDRATLYRIACGEGTEQMVGQSGFQDYADSIRTSEAKG